MPNIQLLGIPFTPEGREGQSQAGLKGLKPTRKTATWKSGPGGAPGLQVRNICCGRPAAAEVKWRSYDPFLVGGWAVIAVRGDNSLQMDRQRGKAFDNRNLYKGPFIY